MFDLSALAQVLGADACRFDVDLLPSCESTNAVLLARAEAGAPSGSVLIAAEQTAGRGRRGRAWLSAPGDSLTFSLLWRFAPATSPMGLSLAVGVAMTRALTKLGAGETALKWPNDVLMGGRKLAGVLIELVSGQPHAVVIGIGLNLRLPTNMPAEVRATAAALDLPVSISALLATLLVELRAVLETFSHAGFGGLREEWTARHAFAEAPVRLLAEFAPPREGICRGVDREGALLLEVDNRIERVLSGEVSLRGAA